MTSCRPEEEETPNWSQNSSNPQKSAAKLNGFNSLKSDNQYLDIHDTDTQGSGENMIGDDLDNRISYSDVRFFDENVRSKSLTVTSHNTEGFNEDIISNLAEVSKSDIICLQEAKLSSAEIKEKKKNIEVLKEKVNAMKSEIAQEKVNLDKKIDKTKEEKRIFMEKELARVESENHDEMIKKKVELTQAQEEVKNIQHDADMAKVENERNLEQQREEEKLIREQTVNSMKEEFMMKDRDFQRQYTLKDAEHKATVEELNKKKEN